MADTGPPTTDALSITVVVTTYNRKDELGKCLDSILKQDYPCEILVLDDASSDGTTEYVQQAYPQVRIERSEKNVGLIGQRTRGGQLATGEVIVTIDDDILLMAENTLSLVATAFDAPDIAAVTIPSVDVLKGPKVLSDPPKKHRRYVTADYRGGAVAMRREIFLELGAYDARLYRQGEEMDLAVRLYGAGYLIAMADIPPIHHYESPRRVRSDTFYYGSRNTMLFCWWRIPWRLLPMYLGIRSWNQLESGYRQRFFASHSSRDANGPLDGLAEFWQSSSDSYRYVPSV